MSSQNLRLNFESRAESDGKMRFGVEGSFLEQLLGQRLSLLGSRISFVELVGGQLFTCRPRESFEVLWIGPVLSTISLQGGIGRSEISLNECSTNVFDNVGKGDG
jgi:hypothetical protein